MLSTSKNTRATENTFWEAGGQNELLFSALLHIKEGVIIADSEGKTVFMNLVAQELTGHKFDSAVDAAIEKICCLISENAYVPAENPVRRTLKENIVVKNFEVTLLSAQGISRFVDLVSTPVTNKKGKLMGAMLSFNNSSDMLSSGNKLKADHAEIKDKHKNMKDSILYARNIQESILPHIAQLSKHFPESFVIYRPKDIVSGDFYWFTECRDKVVVAVADCVGHGVPGALLSMAGCSFLNEYVNHKKIINPSAILSGLDLCIRRLLCNRPDGYHVGDSMDIAICSIDKKANVFEFAGAGRPLLLFANGHFETIDGDKQGVGSLWSGGGLRKYITHLKPYSSENVIYMFSDGYPDQFGGKKQKKMMAKNFIKLLEATLPYGIKEQEKLLGQWLDRWKGKLDQTDDILVLGIKLTG